MILVTRVVLAVYALALLGVARHSTLVALAVVLLALGGAALATLEVLVLLLDHLVLESFDVALQDVFDGLPALSRVLSIVVALGPLVVLALAVGSASGIVTQALTVELEALGALALASHAVDSRLLNFDLTEEFLLGNSLGHDFFSHEANVLLILLILKLLILVGHPEGIGNHHLLGTPLLRQLHLVLRLGELWEIE